MMVVPTAKIITALEADKLEARINDYLEDEMVIDSIHYNVVADESSNYYSVLIMWHYPPEVDGS